MPEHDGSGEIKKTEEQLKQQKAELFAKEPDRFVDKADLVVAVQRSEAGMGIMLRPRNRNELTKAYAELNVTMLRTIMETDYAIEAEKKKIIHPSGGGMMNFARKKFKK